MARISSIIMTGILINMLLGIIPMIMNDNFVDSTQYIDDLLVENRDIQGEAEGLESSKAGTTSLVEAESVNAINMFKMGWFVIKLAFRGIVQNPIDYLINTSTAGLTAIEKFIVGVISIIQMLINAMVLIGIFIMFKSGNTEI